MLKEIAIPMAAFAVTVTGASAFNTDVLKDLDLDLSDSQISALEEVHELREAGTDREEIKEMLEDAGLDRDDMKEIKSALREHRQEMRDAVHAAIEAEDYDAYLDAVEGTPRADIIDSEDDFEKLVEAHELREAGDHEAAREIMDELGFEKPGGKGHHKGGMRGGGEEGGPRGGGFGGNRS